MSSSKNHTISKIVVLSDKYIKTAYNWLFSLAGIFICLYLALFYTRILSIG